ncbi:receptor-like protein kinase FERONIA [Abrus precatorius]|uniref:Receptor-like protein kinase FERONIA n=1 Tax=Abrus precatorius TaxID=3816 RepID=A0A8B8L2Q3_ABRPR|nr:receptor-like protein kinase FERONIA [Abrus precatorius]
MVPVRTNKFSSVAKSSGVKLFNMILFSIMFIIPVNSYPLTEDFAINCGSSFESNSIVGDRIWSRDIDSQHFSLLELQDQNHSSITAVSDPIVNHIPYGTARLSQYEFTYSFSVTVGPKFLRLYFHAASYRSFNRSKSLFSVKAGPYALLKGFNASRVAEEYGDSNKIVLMEYCINVEQGQRLNITFTPNLTKDAFAFINGIEVLSSFKHNLLCDKQNYSGFKLVAIVREADTNHDSSTGLDSSSSSNKKTLLRDVLYSVISTIISVTLIFLLCIWVRHMARFTKRKTEMEMISEDISSKNKSVSPSGMCRHFSIIDIRAATINFDDIFVVGVGGFGKVYQGYIDDGTKPVAIKRFIPNSLQGVEEFRTEVEMLSQLSHPHLVSLIGFCNDEDDMIIVYDFMANGTLRDHLYGSTNAPLSWNQRLEICIGAGLGLEYLHYGANYSVIHRDVKSSNILLDEKWVAKISDFGLCKIGPDGVSKFHVTTQVKGSLGYLDPEYSKTKRLTHKSDVYSFGVVLLEVLCGRPPLLRKVEGMQRSLVEWAQTCHSEGGPQALYQMVDPFVRGTILPECLDKFVEMALNCVVDDGNERPSISEVVKGLQLALQLQEHSRFSGARRPKNTKVNLGEE